MPKRSKVRGQTKCDLPGPLGWGFITETEDIQIATNIGETTRAHSSRMTYLGQSRKETQKPTASIVNPKLETRIGRPALINFMAALILGLLFQSAHGIKSFVP